MSCLLDRHIHAAVLAKRSYHYRGQKVIAIDLWGDRLIIFPGSYSLQHWISNLQMRSLIIPYRHEGYRGKVRLHQGFYNDYLAIQSSVLYLAKTDLNLIFAGHSRGGCLAQIAGVDVNYRSQGKKRVEVVTFGSPACGNEYWAKSADSRINNTSYRNFADLISYILPHNHHLAGQISLKGLCLNPHHISNYCAHLSTYNEQKSCPINAHQLDNGVEEELSL